MWVFDTPLFDPQAGRQVDYFDLCPETPVLFLNHYWDGLPEYPRWLPAKPLYLMPNIEMLELQSTHLWRADVVLCKTRVCHDRVTRWLQQQGNPRNTRVLYTKRTSLDPASRVRREDESQQLQPQDFRRVKFVHTAGTSMWKGTREIVDCWISQRGLLPLDECIADRAYHHLATRYDWLWLALRASPVRLVRGDALAPRDFDALLAETAFFHCPNLQEGYGHYINQARAAGDVVVTTDAHPMNELIQSGDLGVLVPSLPSEPGPRMLLGGTAAVDTQLDAQEQRGGFVASVSADDVCVAVRTFLATTSERQRVAMGARALRQYHRNSLFFTRAIQKLRVLATSHTQYLHSATNSSKSNEIDIKTLAVTKRLVLEDAKIILGNSGKFSSESCHR